MGENSKIEWTHHTFNPWWGCHKVSPGCKHCYAEAFSKRVGRAIWGPTAERWLPSDAYWKQLTKWNRQATATGERHRVFVASMADVGEIHEVPEINTILDRERARLWEHIAACPQLDFLLTTKRPENFSQIVPKEWMDKGFPMNVWVIVTAEDQKHLELRVPHLLALPVRAVRGLSCEPLLTQLNLRQFLPIGGPLGGWYLARCEHCGYTASTAFFDEARGHDDADVVCSRCKRICCANEVDGLSWIIAGGESGHGARAFDVAWARSLRDQCKAAGTAFLLKQLGAKPEDSGALSAGGLVHPWPSGTRTAAGYPPRLLLKDKKGGDWSEWPVDLRVRQFPEVRRD